MDEDLPAKIPTDFDGLQQEVLGYGKDTADEDKIVDEGKLGAYMVVTSDTRGFHGPELENSEGL